MTQELTGWERARREYTATLKRERDSALQVIQSLKKYCCRVCLDPGFLKDPEAIETGEPLPDCQCCPEVILRLRTENAELRSRLEIRDDLLANAVRKESDSTAFRHLRAIMGTIGQPESQTDLVEE